KVQGLLGAGLALAQGMSSAGPRRSAAQNILGALAGGVSAGQGAYQGATQNYLMQQKIAESMLEREKAQNQIASQKEFFARYPHLRGIYGASPAEAAKVAGEEEAWRQIDEAYKGGDTPQVAPQTQVAAQTQIPQDGTQQIAPSETPNVELVTKENPRLLGAVPVETSGIPPEVSNLLNQKQYLLGVNKRLTGKRGGSAEIDKNLKIIEGLDKQIGAYTVANYDFADLRSKLPSEFQDAARQIESLAYSGSISPKDLAIEVNKLQKDAREYAQKQQDFTIEANRVAMAEFGKPINQLTQQQIGAVQLKLEATNSPEYRNYLLAQKDPKFQAYQEGLRRAGATSINMPSESERTAGFLTNRVVNSMQQLQKAVGADPTAASPNFGAEAIKFLTGSDYLKNIANPEKRQQVEAAQLEILDAALTLGTGAAYTREQLENYRRAYFPQIGDKPETIRDKQQRLQALIDSAMIKSGRAAPTASPNMFGITTDDIEKELQRRKGKK
ncbi:hypothetical protein, partial [Flavobacterium sp.]|uniref:hypothetical protein n=1 Tax=Flavobacterium sp. TaxID=239 RepID=UPI0037BE8FA0